MLLIKVTNTGVRPNTQLKMASYRIGQPREILVVCNRLWGNSLLWRVFIIKQAQ